MTEHDLLVARDALFEGSPRVLEVLESAGTRLRARDLPREDQIRPAPWERPCFLQVTPRTRMMNGFTVVDDPPTMQELRIMRAFGSWSSAYPEVERYREFLNENAVLDYYRERPMPHLPTVAARFGVELE